MCVAIGNCLCTGLCPQFEVCRIMYPRGANTNKKGMLPRSESTCVLHTQQRHRNSHKTKRLQQDVVYFPSWHATISVCFQKQIISKEDPSQHSDFADDPALASPPGLETRMTEQCTSSDELKYAQDDHQLCVIRGRSFISPEFKIRIEIRE